MMSLQKMKLNNGRQGCRFGGKEKKDMACLFGHKWNGCTCGKCGKTRDKEHNFQPGGEECLFRCTICGKEKTEHGRFVNGFCERCGKPTKTPIDFSVLTEKEQEEVGNIMCGLLQDRLGANGATPMGGNFVGTRLSLTYANERAYADCPQTEEMISTARTFICNSGCRMTLAAGKDTAAVIRSVRKALERMISGVTPKASDGGCETLTDLANQAPEGLNPLAASRELYKTGMSLSPNRDYKPISGTIAVLDSVLQKLDGQISGFEEGLARKNLTEADLEKLTE